MMKVCLVFLFSLGVAVASLDRGNPLQDLSNTNCNALSFSACAVRNVHLLVTQVLQDLNEARFDNNSFYRVLNLVSMDPLSYRLGNGFAVTVFNENGTILASGYDPTVISRSIGQAKQAQKEVTTADLGLQFIEAAAAGGAWVDDVYYIYNGSLATIPITRKSWVSGVRINNILYGAVSSFNNIDPQLVGRPCASTRFSDCSLGVAQNLVEMTSREVTNLLPSQMNAYMAAIKGNGKYAPPVGFAVTVVRARDGLVVGHSGAGDHVGKNVNSISAGLLASLNQAWTDGGLWFVHMWNEGGVSFERQSIVRFAGPINAETYYIFSGHGTSSESKCPACNCPVCPAVPPCPLCPQITDCDGTEVTKLKMDFKGMF